ncbi:hypothetical protein ACWCPP_32340, partial [Streptomyces sp. NPDC002287]
MITSPIPPVVPAGHMAKMEQPVLALPNGLELRPWGLYGQRWIFEQEVTPDDRRDRVGGGRGGGAA